MESLDKFVADDRGNRSRKCKANTKCQNIFTSVPGKRNFQSSALSMEEFQLQKALCYLNYNASEDVVGGAQENAITFRRYKFFL